MKTQNLLLQAASVTRTTAGLFTGALIIYCGMHVGAMVLAPMSVTAVADETADACISEMCLGVLADPASAFTDKLPMECKDTDGHKGVSAFFDIRRNKKRGFSPSQTANARRKFLDKCESDNPQIKAAIIAKFGMLPSMPNIF